MIVYVDKENKCHVTDDGSLTAVETDFFDGKCKAFIEGYLYCTNENGAMITPFIDYALLAAYQEQYEEMLADLEAAKTDLADADAALNELGVEWEGD